VPLTTQILKDQNQLQEPVASKSKTHGMCFAFTYLRVSLIPTILMVELSGIEWQLPPGADILRARQFFRLSGISDIGGAERDRTADLLRARQALSQLSYSPSMLVFFALCGVALPRSLSHILMYVPSLTRRAPCRRQKILRLDVLVTHLL
jgi:hypothetical protein